MRSLSMLLLTMACMTASSSADEKPQKTWRFFHIPFVSKPFAIAKDTTRLTEPLTKDGLVDYAAALNQMYSKGVTPENNAAVVLWNVFGPSLVHEEIRKEYFKQLGMPIPPAKRKYFVPVPEYSDEEFHEQLSQAKTSPWSRKEFRKIAKWLDENSLLLDKLRDASRRPRFYEPLITAKLDIELNTLVTSGLATAEEPAIVAVRIVVDGLLCRSMLLAKAREFDDSRNDLIAAHRWSRLRGKKATLIAVTWSQSGERQVCVAERAFLLDSRLPAAQFTKLKSELKNLPTKADWGEAFDRHTRFVFLDSICRIAKDSDKWRSLFISYELSENTPTAFSDFVIDVGADWNRLLGQGNRMYDNIADAFREPNAGIREKRLREQIATSWRRKFVTPLESEPISKAILSDAALSRAIPFRVGPWKMPVFIPVLTRGALRREIHELFLGLLAPPFLTSVSEFNKTEAEIGLTRLTIALREYEIKNNRFPQRLKQLTPKYLDKLPIDPFSTTTYRYRPEKRGFVLYSIGPSGTDDGGKSTDPNSGLFSNTDDDDIVVRHAK